MAGEVLNWLHFFLKDFLNFVCYNREILRVIDSLQLTYEYKVATPVDWEIGDECMIPPNVSNKEAEKIFPKGYRTVEMPSMKSYMRMTPQPDL